MRITPIPKGIRRVAQNVNHSELCGREIGEVHNFTSNFARCTPAHKKRRAQDAISTLHDLVRKSSNDGAKCMHYSFLTFDSVPNVSHLQNRNHLIISLSILPLIDNSPPTVSVTDIRVTSVSRLCILYGSILFILQFSLGKLSLTPSLLSCSHMPYCVHPHC